MSWSLTPGQFMCLWETTGLDRMPYPLRYRSPARTQNEYAEQQMRLARWRDGIDDPKLEASIRALRNPDVSVTLYVPEVGNGPAIRRRMCLRGRVGVVADQDDAATGFGTITIDARGGHVRDTLDWMCRGLLAAIPSMHPGRTRSVSADPEELGDAQPTVLQGAQASGAQLIRKIVSRRDGAGYLCVHGPREGASEPLVDELTWLDIADDGRYLYHRDHRVHLRAADTDAIRDALHSILVAATSREPAPAAR
ncbi:ESX secretion-associated protein EspG [Rhodococcus sp. HNM0569]|uniref:ESX secretion-associated protein EspG n=1 Tax=Rhodococcus sp. HNM0569 TaxID=2716340 RepID=UPI00146BBA0C|nr:ESX secretion-associated protein EspG [Rhodococcus sp. HNM0569]NLU84614.1 ESX secretion-associated protein EspG [Rhodococcus sp. HNM0569]